MKLAKFGLTIPIFESQTKQLLCGFEDEEITKIRRDHTYFWKPNRTTTTTRLQRRWNYWNSGWPYPFLKAKQNNNYYTTSKMTKLPNSDRSYPFLKAKQNNNYHTTSKTTKLPKFRQIIPIFKSQAEQQLLYDFKDSEITEIWTDHTHFWKPNRTTTTKWLQRWQNYWNSDRSYPFLKAKQKNNYYAISKTTKLPKFMLTIPIFEGLETIKRLQRWQNYRVWRSSRLGLFFRFPSLNIFKSITFIIKYNFKLWSISELGSFVSCFWLWEVSLCFNLVKIRFGNNNCFDLSTRTT